MISQYMCNVRVVECMLAVHRSLSLSVATFWSLSLSLCLSFFCIALPRCDNNKRAAAAAEAASSAATYKMYLREQNEKKNEIPEFFFDSLSLGQFANELRRVRQPTDCGWIRITAAALWSFFDTQTRAHTQHSDIIMDMFGLDVAKCTQSAASANKRNTHKTRTPSQRPTLFRPELQTIEMIIYIKDC